MPRSKGSSSTKAAKSIATEISDFLGTPHKYNLDILRLIEQLVCMEIADQVSEYDEDTPITDKVVNVEIPLIGNLEITPTVFHEAHGMTNKPSIRYVYKFDPTSAFRQDVIRAFTSQDTDMPDILTDVYVERVKALYSQLRGAV